MKINAPPLSSPRAAPLQWFKADQDGQPEGQVQGMAQQEPGDENSYKRQQEENHSGQLDGGVFRQCLSRAGGHLSHSVVHGLLEGLCPGPR